MITSVRVTGGLAFQVAMSRDEFLEACRSAGRDAQKAGGIPFVSVPVEAPTGGLTEALIAVNHIAAIQGGTDDPSV